MNFKKTNAKCLILLFTALIFAYISFRGYVLAMTHDEAYSFLMATETRWAEMTRTANNHWLNSLFMVLESKILPKTPFFFRLHSIFAYLVLAFFSYKIIEKFTKNTAIVISVWIICNLNPFLLDFFSLARGYGMASAFLVASIFMILEKRWRASFIFAGLAMFSNFTFLHFFNAILAYYIFSFWLEANGNFDFIKTIFKDFRNWFFVPIFYIVALYLLHIVNINGDLADGGYKGMGVDTFYSLLEGFMYFQKLGIKRVFSGNFIFGITILMQIYVAYYFYKTKKILPISFLFALTMDSCLAVFYLFKTPLPLDRTATIFYAMGILSALEILNIVITQVWQTRFAIAIATVFCLHFAQVANLKYCFLWRLNCEVEQINTQCFAPHQAKIIGTISNMDGSILNYYNIVNKEKYDRQLQLIENLSLATPPDTLRNILKKYDMIWVRNQDKAILDQKGIKSAFSHSFPVSQTVVMSGF